MAVTTHAEIDSALGPSDSTHFDVDLAEASAFAEAGATRSTPAGPEVIAFAEATGEIETDIQLNSPTAFVRLAPDGQKATGFAAEAGSRFEASMSAMSAIDTINPVPVSWVIDVLPSAGEAAGAPTQVSIDTVVEGLLSTTGRTVARASWLVLVNKTAPAVLLGQASGGGGGVVPFADAASRDFVLPLGSSFQLEIRWNLTVFGGPGSAPLGSATAEFTAARIDLAATIIPEPPTMSIVAAGILANLVVARRSILR